MSTTGSLSRLLLLKILGRPLVAEAEFVDDGGMLMSILAAVQVTSELGSVPCGVVGCMVDMNAMLLVTLCGMCFKQ